MTNLRILPLSVPLLIAKVSVGAPPAEGSGAAPHMLRHQWAAERMWDALTTPSEAAWLKDTEVMADAPLHVEVVAGERSVEPKVKDLATRVHDIAERGREQRDPAQWPSTYGQFSQTCATCYQALGVGKPAPE